MKFVIDVKKLLESGAYFGHKISRTNPKALGLTYKAQNGIYLIDLFKTKANVEKAMHALYNAGAAGQGLLVVGTKRIIKVYIKSLLVDGKVSYLSEKWVGGFLTNFDEILKNLKVTNQMFEEKQKGYWNELPKHEISRKEKKLNKYLKVYEGVLKLEKVPENILIIDIKKEKNALKEALSVKPLFKNRYQTDLTLYGIVDTNADPNDLNYPMMLNDDSAASLEYVVKNLIDSYNDGLKKAKAVA